MKKLVKRISLALASLLALITTASCTIPSSSSSPSSETTVATMSKVENDYRVEICNFEQWRPDFSLIKVQENFGKVSRNSDPNYVKSGKYSAKLQPVGGVYIYRKPVVYFPFFSETYNFNYQDFTNVDYIQFWMYNDQEKEMPFAPILPSGKKYAILKTERGQEPCL